MLIEFNVELGKLAEVLNNIDVENFTSTIEKLHQSIQDAVKAPPDMGKSSCGLCGYISRKEGIDYYCALSKNKVFLMQDSCSKFKSKM